MLEVSRVGTKRCTMAFVVERDWPPGPQRRFLIDGRPPLDSLDEEIKRDRRRLPETGGPRKLGFSAFTVACGGGGSSSGLRQLSDGRLVAFDG